MAKTSFSENPVREKILKAAVKLLGDSGIKKLAQPQIAKKAGVPQGHMTYYFPTRSDLLMAVAERSFRSVAEAVLKKAAQVSHLSPKESLSLVEPLIRNKSRTRMLVGLLVESDENPELRRTLQDNLKLARELIATVLEKDPSHPDVTLLNATLLGLGIQYHLEDPNLAGEKLDKILKTLAARNQEA